MQLRGGGSQGFVEHFNLRRGVSEVERVGGRRTHVLPVPPNEPNHDYQRNLPVSGSRFSQIFEYFQSSAST